MIKRYSITKARVHLYRLIQEAESGTQVELTRRGKLVAVMIGAQRFDHISQNRPSFWKAYETFRRRFDLEQVEIDTDEIFGDIRDSSLGRDFRWQTQIDIFAA